MNNLKYMLIPLNAGIITCIFICLHAVIFKIKFFNNKKFLSGIPSECQTILIQIKTDVCQAWSATKLFAKAVSAIYEKGGRV